MNNFLVWFFSQWWVSLGGFILICIGIYAMDHDWTPPYLWRKRQKSNPSGRSREDSGR